MSEANERPETKTKGTVRITITITKALKERMAKYDHLINWSAVASNAFLKIMNDIDKGEVKT